MTMGTNGQSHQHALSRSSKRDALIYGFAGVVSALFFLMTFPTADAWYETLGISLTGIMAVVWVAKAIIALRQDDRVVDSE